MFTGFSEKTGGFLWELAFNNERPWFLAHKQEFEDFVNTPLPPQKKFFLSRIANGINSAAALCRIAS